ncbi:MAG: hypothetical protein HYR94_13085 [Chloroflexi bacterium]|nr:hypothetical protein [Chloroflexota bacterium]
MPDKPVLKAGRFFGVLIGAFAALITSFLSLALGSGAIQAASSAQAESLQVVLPVINTTNQASVYTVTNLSGASLITTLHRFYAGGLAQGQVVGQFSDTLSPFQNKAYAVNLISNLPKDFVGDVVVTANQPITGSVTIRPVVVAPANQAGAAAVEINPIFPAPTPTLPLPGQAEVNWTLVTYIIVGIFALSGFFKGWWKEAITTFFVGILIFFLAVPSVAQVFIDITNRLLLSTWEFLAQLGLTQSGQAIQLDGSSSGTWLIILLLFLGLAIFISRASLPNMTQPAAAYTYYVVTPLGSLLGGLLGGLNGFLIINLIRHYLEGTNLPGRGVLPTEIAMAGSGTVGVASSGVGIQLTDLPNFTLFNTLLPWLIVAFGILILFLRWKSDKVPWGYVKYSISGRNLSKVG